MPSGTTAPAATMLPLPITQRFKRVACIPTSTSSSTVQPCTTAAWPMVTLRPMVRGQCLLQCSTAPSCTLLPEPTIMGSISPRSTAPYHTLESFPSRTLPITEALGATNSAPLFWGVSPPQEIIIKTAPFAVLNYCKQKSSPASPAAAAAGRVGHCHKRFITYYNKMGL